MVDNLLFGAMDVENAKRLTDSSQHGRSHLLSFKLRDQAYGNFRNKPRTRFLRKHSKNCMTPQDLLKRPQPRYLRHEPVSDGWGG